MLTVSWDKYLIDCTIEYRSRKTLGISVMPDKRVVVVAPLNTPIVEIEKRVQKRAAWVIKQWNYFDSFGVSMPERRYISGESHFYLGRQYMLRVELGKPNSVQLKGRYINISCTPRKKAGELLKLWYRERAKIKFSEIAQPIIERFSRYGVEPSAIQIQEMDNRWGSCTNRGKIILNPALIKVSRSCIEYVITHEMTHLIHRNHTREFYSILSSEMPKWKELKDKLERFF